MVAFCAELLPKYMLPAAFALRRTPPKTSTGKIDRQSLSAQALGDLLG
jgi:acyl-CoA synthetase (AMP-forming)/AMP-acid ligase II